MLWNSYKIYTKTSYRLERFTWDECEGKWITKLALLRVDRGGFQCHDTMKSILILLPLEHRDGRKLKPEFQQELGMQFAVDCKWSRSGLADEELPLFAESSFSLASAEWCGGLCEDEEDDEKNEGEEQVGEEEDEDVTCDPLARPVEAFGIPRQVMCTGCTFYCRSCTHHIDGIRVCLLIRIQEHINFTATVHPL